MRKIMFFLFLIECLFFSSLTMGAYSFTDTLASDIAITPLTNTSFVVAWVDVNETDVSFKIMNTNGTTILNTVDVDTSASASYSRVSVASINSTYFVVAYINTTNNVFAVYNTGGSLIVGPNIISESDGASVVAPDISVTELGNRFAVGYIIPSAKDVVSSVYYNNGTELATAEPIDTSTGSNSPLWNTLEVVGINNEVFAYVRHDSGPSDVFHGMFNSTINELIGAEHSEDANAGLSGQVALASLDGNKCVAFWYDSANFLVEYSTHYVNETEIVPATTINSGVGIESRVAIATIRKNSSTTNDLFAAAWRNSTAGNISVVVYNAFGGEVTAPFIVTSDQSSVYKLFDIAGRNPITNNTLYPGTFTIAYTNSSKSVFKSFYTNGTEWDGNTAKVSDSCAYSSGNWNVDCSDNCLITSNTDLLGNNISITGHGTFSMITNISNFTNLYVAGESASNRCEVYCLSGGCFK